MAEFNKYSAEDFFDFDSWKNFAKISDSISKKIVSDLDVIGQGIEKTGQISKETKKNIEGIKNALKALEQQGAKSITVSQQLIDSFHKQRKAFEQNAKAHQDAAKANKILVDLQNKLNEISKKVESTQKAVVSQINETVKATKNNAESNKAAAGSFDALKDRVSELKKEMKALGQSNEDLAKKDALNAELKDLTKRMQDFTNEMKEAEKEAKKLSDMEAKLGKDYMELKSNLESVLLEYNKLNQKRSDGIDLTQDEIDTMDRLDKEAKQIAADMKKISDTVNKATSEYDKLSRELNELRKEYKDLAAKKAQNINLTEDEAKRFKELEQRGQELDAILKDIDGTMGQFQRNVGNYSDAIDGFLGNFGGMGQALSGIMQNLANPAALGAMAAVAAGLAFAKLWEEIEKTNKVAKEAANITQLQGKELFIVAGAAEKLAEKYEVDVNRVIRATNAQMKLFGMSAQEATDSLALGLQFAGSEADDLLDAMNEYSPNFKKLGLDGKDAMVVISKAVRNASFTIDKAGDIINNFGIEAFTDDFLQRINKVDEKTANMLKKLKKEGKSGADALELVSKRILELGGRRGEQLKTAAFTAVGEEGVSDAFIRDLANINSAYEDLTKSMTDAEKQTLALSKAQNKFGADFAEFSSGMKAVSPTIERLILSLKTAGLALVDSMAKFLLFSKQEQLDDAAKKTDNYKKSVKELELQMKSLQETGDKDPMKGQEMAKKMLDENAKKTEELRAKLAKTNSDLQKNNDEIQKQVNEVAKSANISRGGGDRISFETTVNKTIQDRSTVLMKEKAALQANIDLLVNQDKMINQLTDGFKELGDKISEEERKVRDAARALEIQRLQNKLKVNETYLANSYDQEAVYLDDKLKLLDKNEKLEMEINRKSMILEKQQARDTIMDADLLAIELKKITENGKHAEFEILQKYNEQRNGLNEEATRNAIQEMDKLLAASEQTALKMKQIFAETEQLKLDAAKTDDEINKIQINRQIEANEKELDQMGLFNMEKSKKIQEGAKMRETIIKVDGENALQQLQLNQKKELDALQAQNDAILRKASTEQRALTSNEVAEIQARNTQIEALQAKHLRDTEKTQADTKDAILQNEKDTTEQMKQLYAQRREMVVNSIGGGFLDMYQNMEQKRIDAIEDENKRNREKIKLMIKMIGLQMILAKLANPKADVSQIAGDGVRGVIGSLGSFKEGGYTGAANTGIYNKDGEITGVTHRNEFVANEETTNKNPKTRRLIKILDTFQKTGNKSVLDKIPSPPTFDTMAARNNSTISDIKVTTSPASIKESDIDKLAKTIGNEIQRSMPKRDISETADLIILRQRELGRQKEIRIQKGRKWFKF